MKDLIFTDFSANHAQQLNFKLGDENNSISENSKDISRKRRTKYLKIDDEKRRIIIFEVMVMNNPLKAVCQKHNINFSSAKNVIQIYKKEGRMEKKAMRTRKNKKALESKSDPSPIQEEDPLLCGTEKQEHLKQHIVNKSSCFVLLKMQDDDSYLLERQQAYSEKELHQLQDMHNQYLTRSQGSLQNLQHHQ